MGHGFNQLWKAHMLIWRFAGLQSGVITTQCAPEARIHHHNTQTTKQNVSILLWLEGHDLGFLVQAFVANTFVPEWECFLFWTIFYGRQQQQWRDLCDILKLLLISKTSIKKPEVSSLTSSPVKSLQIFKKKPKTLKCGSWHLQIWVRQLCVLHWLRAWKPYILKGHWLLTDLSFPFPSILTAVLGASSAIAVWLPDLHMSNWLFWLGGSRGGGGRPPSSVAGGGGGAVVDATLGLAALASCAAGGSAPAAPGSEEGGVTLVLLPSLLLLGGALSLRGSDGGAALSEGGSDEPPCVGSGWASGGVSADASSSGSRMR